MNKIESLYEDFLQSRENQALKRHLTDISRVGKRHINAGGQDYINFSDNDYLGLNQHPLLIERAQEWTARYGAGAGASRLVTGNLDIFTQLEEKIARFKDKEAALIMVSGFQANASVLPALFDKDILGQMPLVFSDRLNHASMHLGCNAAGISQIRYRHNDMEHLAELLEKYSDSEAPKFILTESVFSMDGDIAPLSDIYRLAKKHHCFTVIDEAHATGVLGKNGQGLAVETDLIIGTFSKAFGSFGAYIACSQMLKDFLINKCSGLIYATALPPAVLGSIDAALDLVPAMKRERNYLQKISESFRQEMMQAGFDCGASQTQIVPIIIGDSNAALMASNDLKQKGIWATTIRPPTVPNNTARLRFSFSAAHSEDDITRLIEILKTTPLKKAA